MSSSFDLKIRVRDLGKLFKSSCVKTEEKNSFKISAFSPHYDSSLNFKSGTFDLLFNFEFAYFQYPLLLFLMD